MESVASQVCGHCQLAEMPESPSAYRLEDKPKIVNFFRFWPIRETKRVTVTVVTRIAKNVKQVTLWYIAERRNGDKQARGKDRDEDEHGAKDNGYKHNFVHISNKAFQ